MTDGFLRSDGVEVEGGGGEKHLRPTGTEDRDAHRGELELTSSD